MSSTPKLWPRLRFPAIPVALLLPALGLFGLILFLPAELWAWGPGTHLKFASAIFSKRDLLHPEIARLIAAHPGAYFYGNIIADLILGKKYRIRPEEHSHNWAVAWNLLARAKDDLHRALSWGYLSHLAADVVAHNAYVPAQMVLSAPARTQGHAFWEMHYDAHAPERLVQAALQVQELGRSADPFVMDELAETIFSHRTNRFIFTGTLWVQRTQIYRNVARRSATRNPWRVDEDLASRYDDLAMRAIFDLMRQGPRARVQVYDPNGHAQLAEAQKLSNRLRRRDRLRPDEPDLSIERDPEWAHGSRLTPFEKLLPHPFEPSDQLPELLDLETRIEQAARASAPEPAGG